MTTNMWRSWCALFSCFLAVQLTFVEATTLADRTNCSPGDPAPPERVDTTARLTEFRTRLASTNVGGKPVRAYIIYTQDAHNSEYPTEYDERRAYISGFKGSAGTAVITATKAALWTDGRYFLEADQVLDCNWILMKSGLAETPTIAEWINSEMTGNGDQVGVDRTLIKHSTFTTLEAGLAELSNSPSLIAAANPIDLIWTSDRPAQPNNTINALNITFAGVTWQDKIANLRANLTSKGVDAFAVTALDEIAWLFNLRGSDIIYNPFFLAYAIIQPTQVRLYILDHLRRLTATPTDAATKETLAEHLGTNPTGSCVGITGDCVAVLLYDQASVESALVQTANTGRVWITHEANYAIYQAVQSNRYIDKSPVALDKSKKNAVERAGMQRAYNRDSAALIKFLAFMEKEIKAGNTWTEVSAAAELDKRRGQLEYSRGLSFETISGYGSNGAVIHYRASAITDKTISTDSLYLLDSGGQYLDGTTDVTRTMHYGTPTTYQKECYTRVLMSVINLAMLKWPAGLYGRQIDAITRSALWEVGLVYRHGTGHGIGAYLSVHEGPGRISLTRSPIVSQEALAEYQYYSDEPGYYEDNSFGIRLETIMMVDPVTPKYTTANEPFLGFKAVTYVPFETNLIDYSLMNAKQVAWLNDYNALVKSEMLPHLTGDQGAIDWLNARTRQVSTDVTCHGAANGLISSTALIVAVIATLLRLSV